MRGQDLSIHLLTYDLTYSLFSHYVLVTSCFSFPITPSRALSTLRASHLSCT